jgi:hypothetical protein
VPELTSWHMRETKAKLLGMKSLVRTQYIRRALRQGAAPEVTQKSHTMRSRRCGIERGMSSNMTTVKLLSAGEVGVLSMLAAPGCTYSNGRSHNY